MTTLPGGLMDEKVRGGNGETSGAAVAAGGPKMLIRSLNFYYGAKHILQNISLEIPDKTVTALIGPSRLREVHRFCAR